MLRLTVVSVAALLFLAAAAPAGAGVVGSDLAVTVTDSPDPVAAGQNLTYTITVTDQGSTAAANAALNDSLPANTTFVSLTAPAGWACTTPAVGGTGGITCTNASLAAGASAVFTLVVNVNAGTADGTTLSNTASATTTDSDPNPGNDSDTETTSVVTSADLALTVTDSPDPVAPGSNITYTETVAVNGPSDAQNVTFSGAVPTGTTFVSLTAPAGWACTVPVVGGTGGVTCTRATLAAGTGAQTFTFVVAVSSSAAPGSTISNTASVSSTTTDPNAANSSDTETTAIPTPTTTTTDDDEPAPVVNPAPVVQQPIMPLAAGPKLICRRVPNLVRHSISGARFILARDSCKVKLRWVGRYRKGGRRRNRITRQSVPAGTPLYEGATLTVRINGRKR